MRRRHASWCADFVAQVSASVRGRDEAAWWARLDSEVDNLRAALTWATGADDADLSMALLGNFEFWTYYTRRLGYLLGAWATAALTTTGAAEHPDFAQALTLRSVDHFNHQRIDDAEHDARRAVELIDEPGTPFNTNPWIVLSTVLITSGRAIEIEGAETFLEAARATGDDYTLASALGQVAFMWYILDDTEHGLPLAEEATMLAQQIGNPTLITNTGTWLGVALEATDPPRARTHPREPRIEHGQRPSDVGSTSRRRVAPMGAGADGRRRRGPTVGDPVPTACHRHRLHEEGDTRLVLTELDTYAQALAATDRAETRRDAPSQSRRRSRSPHHGEPHLGRPPRRETNERAASAANSARNASPTSPHTAPPSGTTRRPPSPSPNSTA